MKKLLLGELQGICIALLLLAGMAYATQTLFLNYDTASCTDVGGAQANLVGTWKNNACPAGIPTSFLTPTGYVCQTTFPNSKTTAYDNGSCSPNCCLLNARVDFDSRTADDACDRSSISQPQTYLTTILIK